MRLFSTIVLLLVCHLVVGQSGDTIIVEVRSNNTFSPKSIEIKAGQTIIWKNTGGFHNVNGSQSTYPGNPRSFSSGDPSNSNWEYAFTFDKPGYYQYRCDPHFDDNMVGDITVVADIIITEIMYNPPESGTDLFEYIEFYNNGPTAVNLKNYRFVDGITYLFPGFNLGPGEYGIIAENAQVMADLFGLSNVLQWQGSLNNNGESLAILSPDGLLVDEVVYGNGGEWPIEANGFGSSLVLCNTESDNSDATNWQAATTQTGVISNSIEMLGNPGSSSLCLDGPIIRFVGTEAIIKEDEGVAEVMISLVSGQGTIAFDLLVDAANSSATLGEDFNFTFNNPSFSPNAFEETLTFNIPIVDDNIGEDLETIVLILNRPSGGASIDPEFDRFEITIEDDEEFNPDIIITEIFYNSPDGPDEYEFIELFNNSAQAVNLEGFQFTQGINYTFPAIIIQPEEFLIVAKNSTLFQNTFEVSALEWTGGEGLRNNGEAIELQSPKGITIDLVAYSDTEPWDPFADGNGPSLDLCNINADNNDANNWKIAISETGVEIEGLPVFASPGELRGGCAEEEPSSKYPRYPIGNVTTNDKEGVADSLFSFATLQGIVHGINFNASTGGLSFNIIDRSGDGITVFSRNNFDYTVTEGDEVQVQGEILQFNGLTEIHPDSLQLISQGNKLVNPKIINSLGEDTESQLIKIEDVTIVDQSQWTNLNTGFNVELTNGDRTFTMRIDADTEIFGTPVIDGTFSVIGLGTQFDRNAPFNEGYQILPRYLSDFEFPVSRRDESLDKRIELYPNPARSIVNLETSIDFDQISISNFLGQTIQNLNPVMGRYQLDLSSYSKGLYQITFVKGNNIWSKRLVKE